MHSGLKKEQQGEEEEEKEEEEEEEEEEQEVRDSRNRMIQSREAPGRSVCTEFVKTTTKSKNNKNKTKKQKTKQNKTKHKQQQNQKRWGKGSENWVENLSIAEGGTLVSEAVEHWEEYSASSDHSGFNALGTGITC